MNLIKYINNINENLDALDNESIEQIWNNKDMLNLRKSMIGKVRQECIYCGRHEKLDVTNKNFLFKY